MIEVVSGSAYVGVGSTAGTDAGGYFVGIDTNGSYWLATSIANVLSHTYQLNGSLGNVSPNSWHTLHVNLTSTTLTAGLDGTQLFTSPVASRAGAVAIGAGGYYGVQFDNFRLAAVRSDGPTPAPPGPGPAPAPAPAANCIAPATEQYLQIFGCAANSTDAHQSWNTATRPGGAVVFQLEANPSLCVVPAPAHGTKQCSGQCLVLGSCTDAVVFVPDAHQRFITNGTMCLDVDLGRNTDYRVELYACNRKNGGGRNEQFEFDEATGILSSLWFGSMTSCVAVCGH